MKCAITLFLTGTFFLFIPFLMPLYCQVNQSLPNSGTMEAYVQMGNSQIIQSFDFRYEGVKGTPYLYENWMEGYVNFIGNEEEADPKTYKMNINLYEHQVYVALSSGAVGSLPAKMIKNINFKTPSGEVRFIPLPRKIIEASNLSGSGYYELLHQGAITLIKNHKKIFQAADFKGAYSSDIRYDEYKDDIKYYISSDGKNFEKIRLNSKYLEKALPAYENNIKQIRKEEKLDCSKEEDVKKLLSLLEKE